MKIVKLLRMLFIFTIGAFPVVVHGNSHAINTSQNKLAGLIGEQIRLTITLKSLVYDSVSINTLNSVLTEKKLLYRSVILGKAKTGGNTEIRIVLTSTKAGKIVLNRIPVMVYKDAVADTFYTDPIHIEFKEDQVISALQDIKPVISSEVSTLRSQFLLYVSGFLALSVACVIAFMMYNKSHTKSLPAEAIRRNALAEIDKLQNLLMNSSVQCTDVQDHTFKIFKEYLEVTLKINLQDNTVEALADQLSLLSVGAPETDTILQAWEKLGKGRFAPVSGDIKGQIASLQEVKLCIQSYPLSFQVIEKLV